MCLLQKLRGTKNLKLEQIIKKCLWASEMCSFAISSKQKSNQKQDNHKLYRVLQLFTGTITSIPFKNVIATREDV